MKKIRVVIVDDSSFMRKALESIVAKEPDIEVVGMGANGEQAIELAKTLKPDVMTLDVEMPVMDGITALKEIMANYPLPVIMVSSITKEGADTTLKALEVGAVDFITKDQSYGSVGVLKIADDLKEKLRRFAQDKGILKRVSLTGAAIKDKTPNIVSAADMLKAPPIKAPSGLAGKKVVFIGISTGGPLSLQKLVPALPGDLNVPVIIVQHMPPNFTDSLAHRLNAISKLQVIEASDDDIIKPNIVYIAKGGFQMTLKKNLKNEVIIKIKEDTMASLYNPSVDITASSMVSIYGRDMLGIIMTGMGNDGTKSMSHLRQSGGVVLAQDEASCVVYGMPKSVYEAKVVNEVVSLDDMAKRIEYYCRG